MVDVVIMVVVVVVVGVVHCSDNRLREEESRENIHNVVVVASPFATNDPSSGAQSEIAT